MRWLADNVNNRRTRQPARALTSGSAVTNEDGTDGLQRKTARRASRQGASSRADRSYRTARTDRPDDRVTRRRPAHARAGQDPGRPEYGRQAEGHRAAAGHAGRGPRRSGDRADRHALPREPGSQEAGRAFTAFPSAEKSGRASIEAPAHQRRASSRRRSWKWRCG